MMNVITRSVSIHGFILADSLDKHDVACFMQEYIPLVANRSIKFLEHRTYGLDKIGDSSSELLKGGNQ